MFSVFWMYVEEGKEPNRLTVMTCFWWICDEFLTSWLLKKGNNNVLRTRHMYKEIQAQTWSQWIQDRAQQYELLIMLVWWLLSGKARNPGLLCWTDSGPPSEAHVQFSPRFPIWRSLLSTSWQQMPFPKGISGHDLPRRAKHPAINKIRWNTESVEVWAEKYCSLVSHAHALRNDYF